MWLGNSFFSRVNILIPDHEKCQAVRKKKTVVPHGLSGVVEKETAEQNAENGHRLSQTSYNSPLWNKPRSKCSPILTVLKVYLCRWGSSCFSIVLQILRFTSPLSLTLYLHYMVFSHLGVHVCSCFTHGSGSVRRICTDTYLRCWLVLFLDWHTQGKCSSSIKMILQCS